MPTALDLTRDGIIAALRPVNPSPAFLDAVARMDEWVADCERQGAIRRSKERAARRKLIRHFRDPANYTQLAAWMSAVPTVSQLETPEQAVRVYRRRIARLRYVQANGGWSPELAMAMPAIRNRLVVARYFARFGAALWALEAA